MPHQLVAAGAGDPLNQHHVGRVLEDRPMALLKNVLEIFGGAPARRIVLAHVAEAPGELRDSFAVTRFPLPLDRQMGRLQELGTGDEGDARSADDFHGSWELGAGSWGPPGAGFSVSHDRVLIVLVEIDRRVRRHSASFNTISSFGTASS